MSRRPATTCLAKCGCGKAATLPSGQCPDCWLAQDTSQGSTILRPHGEARYSNDTRQPGLALATCSASPKGLGLITNCPVCGSKNLKDESGFILEGVSCKTCGWVDIDGGVCLTD